MARIHVSNTLDDLHSDLRKIPVTAKKDMRQIVRQGAIVGNDLAKTNARRTQGRHGKHYSKSMTWEMSASLFGGAGFSAEYGPEVGRRQGGMSFEHGSRNQPPHNDLAKSADVIGPAFHGEVSRKVASWFWPA